MPPLPDLASAGQAVVPGHFPEGDAIRFLDFFDFGFKRYLTPWIVRHIWLWTVCLLGLGLMIQVAVYVHKSLPSREVVKSAYPGRSEDEERVSLRPDSEQGKARG